MLPDSLARAGAAPTHVEARLAAVEREQQRLDELGAQVAEQRSRRDAALAVLNGAMQLAGYTTITSERGDVYRVAALGRPAILIAHSAVHVRPVAPIVPHGYEDTQVAATRIMGLQA